MSVFCFCQANRRVFLDIARADMCSMEFEKSACTKSLGCDADVADGLSALEGRVLSTEVEVGIGGASFPLTGGGRPKSRAASEKMGASLVRVDALGLNETAGRGSDRGMTDGRGGRVVDGGRLGVPEVLGVPIVSSLTMAWRGRRAPKIVGRLILVAVEPRMWGRGVEPWTW
jgi:hypothetical protein